MATQHHSPRAPEDLRSAVAAVQAAYDRLMAAPQPDPQLVLDLRRLTRQLDSVTEQTRRLAPHGRSERIQCRCAGAARGAQWIIQHAT